MRRRSTIFQAAVLLPSALMLSGCLTPAPQGTGAGGQVSAGPNAPAKPVITVGRRAQSAVEGLLLGAVVGSSAGPIGAAVGAGTFLIYGALTGHSPMRNGGGSRGGGGGGYGSIGSEEAREAALEEQIAQEAARGDVLEDEIEAELRRQEELLEQIDGDEASTPQSPTAKQTPSPKPVPASTAPANAPAPDDDTDLAERADPRSAPAAPKERQLPLAIFEKENVTVEKGEWGDNKKMTVTRRSLDADNDGKPEQIRYYDASNELLRKEQDQNYDGKIDTWSSYKRGSISEREIDTNDDGRIDAWESYESGKMVSRQVDRDHDGVRDAFYSYQAGSLVEERHDANNDGKTDLNVSYRNRERLRSEEDRNKNGQVDMWVSYHVADGVEMIARIEKDENGDGKADVFETYRPANGKPEIAKREEDKNGDGAIDVTSIYEKGKLVRREIADPNMVPL